MKCVDIFSRRFMTDRQQEENGNNGGKRDHPEHLRAEGGLQQRQNKQRQRAADPGECPAETDPGGANGSRIESAG